MRILAVILFTLGVLIMGWGTGIKTAQRMCRDNVLDAMQADDYGQFTDAMQQCMGVR